MNGRFFLQSIGILAASLGLAQSSAVHKVDNLNYRKGIILYNQGQYSPALHFFEQQYTTAHTDIDKVCCTYYIAATSLLLDKAGSENRVIEFVEQYPYSPFVQPLSLKAASYYFQRDNYTKAMEWYQKVQHEQIPKEEYDKHYFQLGYTYFKLEDYAAAKKYLEQTLESEVYGNKAAYYLGYIAYEEESFDVAKRYFSQVETDDELGKDIAYYQADMNFQQKDYDNSIRQGIQRLKSSNSQSEISELSKMVGESYFNNGEFEKALPYLEAYKGKDGAFTATDFYYLGYAYYKKGEYQKAIEQFNQIVEGKDATAQNAYYHLAECYLKTEQKPQALNAFRNAWEMPFSAEIKKDALLNYARLSYEIGNPYESTPSVIERYLKTYPGENTAQMQGLLVESYLTSGNYSAVLDILEGSKNQEDRKIYYHVSLMKGQELYADRQYTEALSYLEKAQKTIDTKVKSEAYRWGAETHYQLKNFEKAQQNYQKLLDFNPAYGKINKEVFYGLGYAYFNQRNYTEATEQYQNYINLNPSDIAKKNDAYIRLADSYFVRGKYWQAMEVYNKIVEDNTQDTDYAAFQKAISYGFVDRNSKKIEELGAFVKKYTVSAYREDALYELGNTYVATGDLKQGQKEYRLLQQEYPQGKHFANAKLREALIYYNMGDNASSLKILKQLAHEHPNTSEALQAVATAKSIYIDEGKVSEYATWTKELGYVNITNAELESASFEAAERQYLQQHITEAQKGFEEYLKEYPAGLHKSLAEFYLAGIYLSKNEQDKAQPLLELFLKVEKNGANTEQALVMLSGIYVDKKQPQKALPLLQNLEKRAAVKQNVTYAHLNLMDIYAQSENHTKAIEYAQKVLKSVTASAAMKDEANLVMARSSFALKDEAKSKEYYQKVAPQAMAGLKAETLYFDAYFKNKEKKYKESNEIIQLLAKDYGSYKVFSGKGLILMADNFKHLGDDYQHSYILNAVIDNFIDYPEIIAQAKAALPKTTTKDAKPKNR